MKVAFVDLTNQYQSLKKEIDQAIHECLNQALFVDGEPVRRFEQLFAEYNQTDYAVSCGNGTDALELALQGLQIGAGDEVIVPAMSWISTAEVVSTVGAKLVFADVLPGEYTLDPEDVQRKMTPHTKAIIPVHLYGRPARMGQLTEIAASHNLKIIEDCAHAHGAVLNGKKVGSIGDVGTFSFYPSKNLGAYGDGGAIVTDNQEVAERIRMLANHGQKGKHNHLLEGRNSRLDTIQAKILSIKLAHLDQWNEKREAHALLYQKLLHEASVILPEIPKDSRHVFHVYAIRVKNREQVVKYLESKGVQTNIHYPKALPFVKAYERLGHTPSDFPVAARYQEELLSLPMYPELTNEQIEYVCEHLLKAVSTEVK